MDEAFADGKAHLHTVYLDTSFLSQLAKAEMRPKSMPNAEAWSRLIDALRSHVNRGTAICPASEFQVDESLLLEAPDLIRKINAIQHELSNGYCFRYWWEIVVRQTGALVLKYMGVLPGAQHNWSAVVRRILVSASPDDTRAAKENFRQFLYGLQEAMPLRRSYLEQRELEKQDLVHQLFLAPDNLCFRMLLRECHMPAHRFPLQFFDSKLIDEIPYVDIFSSIRASLAVHEPTRKPKGSDLFDAAAVASVLPYCDVVTTDKNVQAHIINRLHYDSKYAAQILAPTKAGVEALLEML